LGAVEILSNKAAAKKKNVTKMCPPTKSALETTQRLTEQSFGLEVKIVACERYREIANYQNTIGDEWWIHAPRIMVMVFALCELYAMLRFNVYKGYNWFHLLLQVTNKGISWAAVAVFALAQLPSVIARISNIVRRRSIPCHSRILKWALGIRKHLGLISLWFLGVHNCISLLLFNPSYYSEFFVVPTANSSELNVIGETSFFFEIIGTMFYAFLGVCSLPSVGTVAGT
jgi:hypothetical protein